MRLTDKQKLITEFFDFYSINELYLRCGGFRDIGYKEYSVFVSARAEEKIKAAYEEIVNGFYAKVYAALVKSVTSELKHFNSNAYSPVGYSFGAYGLYKFYKEKYGLTDEAITLARKLPDVYPEIAHLLFDGVKWSSDYGGKKWAKGTQALIDSKDIKTTEDKLFWTDQVLDLYHNNGHMLNKTMFKALSDKAVNIDGHNRTPLSFRAGVRSITRFIPFNSPRVAKLVIPQKNKLTFA